MRQVTEKNQPIIVERSGKPQVVILSVQQYERLKAGSAPAAWQPLVAQARHQIQTEINGQPLPSVAELLAQMRQERSEQLTHLP